jgi:hypothetical protein
MNLEKHETPVVDQGLILENNQRGSADWKGTPSPLAELIQELRVSFTVRNVVIVILTFLAVYAFFIIGLA